MRLSFIFTMLLLINACATLDVDVDYDPSADFKRLSRYAWQEEKQPASGNVLLDSNTLLHDRIRAEVEQSLAARGFKKSDVANADFLAIYRVMVEDKTRVTLIDPFYSYPYNWRYGYYHRHFYSSFAWSYFPEERIYEYQQGTIVIDFVNPKSKKLLWRGAVTEDIGYYTDQVQKQRFVEQAVKSILARFPPQRK